MTVNSLEGVLRVLDCALLTDAQRALRDKHGTPAEFAASVYQAVPGFISMDEAAQAVREYNAEWTAAAQQEPKP